MRVHRLIVLPILILSLSNSAYAGAWGFTTHSRANCVNNESISWDLTKRHNLYTISQHFKSGSFLHQINTGWEYTHRSAAVHWGEALPNQSAWKVEGYHWANYGHGQVLVDHSIVTNCSIYDGWWD